MKRFTDYLEIIQEVKMPGTRMTIGETGNLDKDIKELEKALPGASAAYPYLAKKLKKKYIEKIAELNDKLRYSSASGGPKIKAEIQELEARVGKLQEGKKKGTFQVPITHWYFMQIDKTNWEKISAQTFNKILKNHLPYDDLQDYMDDLETKFMYQGKSIKIFKHFKKGVVVADNIVNAGINVVSIPMQEGVNPDENTEYLRKILDGVRLKKAMTAIHPFNVDTLVTQNSKTYAGLKITKGWEDWLTA